MKAVLQRVSSASVSIDGKVVGELAPEAPTLHDGADSKAVNKCQRARGLMILFGVAQGDSEKESTYIAQKVVDLRIFSDEHGKMNRSLIEIGGSVLVVSQFTLFADWRSGRRPGFTGAAAPAEGKRLYEHFVSELKRLGVPVQTGEFGADMEISLVNDGPVTLILEHQFAQAPMK
ncbi:MAG: D-aminoacyl-tRNA deacylase [Candidatus Obscuribacterales bacterium]|nr:D-aminoacyl-tRNA deacylase [Candidatus Obscuribacterales bacterium]